MLAGRGARVARPFNLRFLLPWACRDDLRRWWVVWSASWLVAGGGLVWWGWDLGWSRAFAAAALCLGLAGVLGPHVVIPVGVDLPSMALSIVAVAAFHAGCWPLAVALVLVAALIKE